VQRHFVFAGMERQRSVHRDGANNGGEETNQQRRGNDLNENHRGANAN
jgi:hypothetical protein